MIVSANQPYFAPFAGFFYKAHLSDVFVILDEVQFPRGTTWVSRNRFKSHRGALWMTVPVLKKGLGLQRINDVRIYGEGRWRAKHLESLKTAYAHAPYFKDHLAFVEEMFAGTYDRLIDLNVSIIRYLFNNLGIETELELLSGLGVSSTGSARLVDICKRLGPLPGNTWKPLCSLQPASHSTSFNLHPRFIHSFGATSSRTFLSSTFSSTAAPRRTTSSSPIDL
jgi:hypothetical protein